MHQKPFGGRTPPGPAGELTALPRPSWIKEVALGKGWWNGEKGNKERVIGGGKGKGGKGRKGRE